MKELYASIIFPINLHLTLNYKVPKELVGVVTLGSYVRAHVKNKERVGVIEWLGEEAPDIAANITLIDIIDVVDVPPLTSGQLLLINWISEYYLCAKGEVVKGSFPTTIAALKEGVTASNKAKESSLIKPKEGVEITLSNLQQDAYCKLKEHLNSRKPTLVKGVTGSGKSELFLKLAQEYIAEGKSVLYMVPEIALSKEFSKRVKGVFGEKTHIFHSVTPPAERKRVRGILRSGEEAVVILGLRSALFLPFNNLGLIIVDEEHDQSYKQKEPAPRYHARDVAIVVASHFNAPIVLGSATPSLESLYNSHIGKFALVELNENYYSREPSTIEVIDIITERKLGRVVSHFAKRSLELIEERVGRGEQVMVFRNRRSYSPLVQCMYCGDIPMCSRCNVPLNYHKRGNILKCHYCSYKEMYTTICKSCGKPGVRDRGSGTEKVEESLKELFPTYRIERFDGEVALSKRASDKILTQFSKGEIDILVGTQILSKGFDFEKLSLIIVLEADSLLSVDDFRASERAVQLLEQLKGRSGRREQPGTIIIQSSQPTNPIYTTFLERGQNEVRELQERKEFRFPPFIRLVRIDLKSKDIKRLEQFSLLVAKELPLIGIKEFTGPVTPLVDRVKENYIVNFWIKFDRGQKIVESKERMRHHILELHSTKGSGITLSFDVDPQ